MASDVACTTIKLISYNCRSFNQSYLHVQDFCRDYDVIALQEHWLLPDDIDLLRVRPDFEYSGSSAVDTSAGTLIGRSYGGVAVLWRRSLFQSVIPIDSGSKRIAAVRLQISEEQSLLVMSVYMPTECNDNLPLFSECLAKINSVIDESDTECVIALGDYNTGRKGMFAAELSNYCVDHNWICADVDILGESSNTYTYTSDMHGTTSWLDHCIVTSAARELVSQVYVLNDVFTSDHLPLVVQCNVSMIKPKILPAIPNHVNKVLWGQRDVHQIEYYNELCKRFLMSYDWPELPCTATNVTHHSIIDTQYSNIINSLSKAAVASYRGKSVYKKKQITGWNYHVKELHEKARIAYQMWQTANCPTQGPYLDNMKYTKKQFKNKIKWCTKHKNQIKMDIISKHRRNNDFKQFWKDTNNLNPKGSVPVSVNGSQDNKVIANMFINQFKVDNLSNVSVTPQCCPPDTSAPTAPAACPPPYAEQCNDLCKSRLTAEDIRKCVHAMKRGKSPGHDGLSVEHVIYGGQLLHEKIALFMNACIQHGYLPADFMRTLVVPIVKNKTGDISSLTNYRPISLATVLSKIMERIIYPELNANIKLSNAQFGFRANLSTDLAIFALKNTVKSYLKCKTSVYACFLDLSKAFDTLNYNTLWNKLRNTCVPGQITNLLEYWYNHQDNQVRWRSTLSSSYKLNNGVRQGGLTSPILFNLYINGLIEELSKTRIGCHVGGVNTNNMSYADDMVLLSPSVAGLRSLIEICEKYALKHNLIYNVKKSEVMVFKSGTGPSIIPPIKLCGAPLALVTTFKYLGHVLTGNLNDDCDLERQRRAIAMKSNMLARRFSQGSTDVKLTLFKAYCQAFYTAHLWQNYKQSTYNTLRVQYNNGFRALLGLPWRCSASGMFADHRVDDFYAVMRRMKARFHNRLLRCDNEIVSAIFTTLYMYDDNFNSLSR
ncbi:hypothetical protein O0L34_g5592 [Tuta absoluta]|nr:hypothetical protein O0L34_g5592 [Tuta absoluta]